MTLNNILDPGINFSHPDVPAAKPETPVAPIAPVAEDATTAQTTPKKWAGKYDSPEALEQGYQNSAEEAQRILARERTKDQEIASLKMQIDGRVNPASQSAQRKHVDELTEALVPVDALGAFVKEQVAEFFRPIAEVAQARQQVTKEYSEFGTVEGKLQDYLTTNPDINARYQKTLETDPATAMEWLLFRYQHANPPPAPTQDLSGQEQATARAVGALSGSTVGARQTELTQHEKHLAARQRFAQTGDVNELLRTGLLESGFIVHPDIPKG